jgi:NADH-quinone oxidoreductase subunit L
MLLATLAIAGVPFLSGFFSKDQILGETFVSGHPVLWALAALTAGLTAFYMFRLIKMTFFGEYRGPKETWEQVHESPATMTVVLWILALGAVLAGYLGIPNFLVPGGNRFETFLEPSFPVLPADWTPHAHEVPHSLEWTLMLASIAVAGLGILLATTFFYKGSAPWALPAKVVGAFPNAYRWVRNKYFVDEFYEAVFVNGLVKKGGSLLWEIDARVVDGLVNGTRHLTVGLSHLSNWFDRTFVDGAVNGVGDSFQAAFKGYGKLQTGQTQNYAFGMAAGVFALVCIYIIFA